jgi:hypothetical protein
MFAVLDVVDGLFSKFSMLVSNRLYLECINLKAKTTYRTESLSNKRKIRKEKLKYFLLSLK